MTWYLFCLGSGLGHNRGRRTLHWRGVSEIRDPARRTDQVF